MSETANYRDGECAAALADWAAQTGAWLADRVERGRARRGRPQPIESLVFHAAELDDLVNGFSTAAGALAAMAPPLPAPPPAAPMPPPPPARTPLPPYMRIIK